MAQLKIELVLDTKDEEDFFKQDTFSEHEIRTVLMDAFHEFSSNRGVARAYVENHNVYKHYPIAQREQKIAQVARRIRLAEQLHRASFAFLRVVRLKEETDA
jgi:hypothetical protein